MRKKEEDKRHVRGWTTGVEGAAGGNGTSWRVRHVYAFSLFQFVLRGRGMAFSAKAVADTSKRAGCIFGRLALIA